MTESLNIAIETMKRAMNGSAATYRSQLLKLIQEAQLSDARAGLLESMIETNRVLADRLTASAKVLEGYEKWEADIISSDDTWELGRLGHPWMTDELYETMMELQHERNEVLRPTPAKAE